MNSQTVGRDAVNTVVLANGVFSGVCGAAIVLASGQLHSHFGLNSPLVLILIGAMLILWAIALLRTGRQPSAAAGDILAIVLLDIAWVFASLVLVGLAWTAFSETGKWLVGSVAIVVAFFAAAQFYLRPEPAETAGEAS